MAKIAIHSFYKNDFLKHEAHFCSKFKKKLKTMPALAANKRKTNKKKVKLINETKIWADSKPKNFSDFLVFASKIATI